MSNLMLVVLGLLAVVHVKTVMAVLGALAVVLMLLGCVYVADAFHAVNP